MTVGGEGGAEEGGGTRGLHERDSPPITSKKAEREQSARARAMVSRARERELRRVDTMTAQ